MTALFLQQLSTDICPPGSMTFQGGRRHERIQKGLGGPGGGESLGTMLTNARTHSQICVCAHTEGLKTEGIGACTKTARSTQL